VPRSRQITSWIGEQSGPGTIATWGSLALFLTGCQTAAPTRSSEPAPPPPAAVKVPTASRPATEPSPQLEPALPDGFAILERITGDEAGSIQARVEPVNRLIVETRNVRRIHIDRDRLPLDSRRAIILQIDGQSFEWLTDSDVSEFQRSPNGQWGPARPGGGSRSPPAERD